VEPLTESDRKTIKAMNRTEPPRRITGDQAAAVANVFDDVYALAAEESRTDCPLPDLDAA
jgi:hypothetical protein